MMGFAGDKTKADEPFIIPRKVMAANIQLGGVLMSYAAPETAVVVKQMMGFNFLSRELGQQINDNDHRAGPQRRRCARSSACRARSRRSPRRSRQWAIATRPAASSSRSRSGLTRIRQSGRVELRPFLLPARLGAIHRGIRALDE